jgi:glycosyltransferase involved in cell wall biosynthesis
MHDSAVSPEVWPDWPGDERPDRRGRIIPLGQRGAVVGDAGDARSEPRVLPYRVSVVIPTRNRARLLAEAIRSVRAIEGPDLNLEVLVVDNGSTDDTEQVASALGARVLRSPIPGPAATRNVGIRAATGDYIAFLDDDDLWLPGQLRAQLALLAAQPDLDACFGQVLPTDADGRPLGDLYPHSLPPDGDAFEALLCSWPQIGALVIRASVRETVGYQDESLLTAEDWDWQLRIALRHRIGHVAVPGLMFRSRPAATAYEDETNLRRVDVDRRVFWRYVWRGRSRILSPTRVLRAGLRYDGVYAGYFVRSGATHAAARDRAAARRSLILAARISPLHLVASVLRRPSSLRWIAWTLLGWPAR